MTTNLEAPSTRVSVIRAWLARPPRAAVDLVLRASSGVDAPDTQLGVWSVDEVTPDLSSEIVQSLDEHAQTVGGAVSARLAYRSAEGAEVKTKALQRSVAAVAPPERLDDVVLDGSPRSQVVQSQAMAQAFAQLMLRSNATVLAQSVALSQQASDVARVVSEALGDLRARLRAEQAAADELRAALAAGHSGESEGAAKLAELLGPHVPMLAQLVAAKLARS